MWQWDNSQNESQFIKVYLYTSKYGLQHGVLAHTEQQVINGSSVKPFKQENKDSVYIKMYVISGEVSWKWIKKNKDKDPYTLYKKLNGIHLK